MHRHESDEPGLREIIDHRPGERRILGGLLTGAAGWGVGSFFSNLFLTNKLYDFDAKVAEKTRLDILSRGGLGAAGAEGNLGGLAAGMSSHEIEAANQFIVANSGEEFSFAKKMLKVGGRRTISMMVGAVAGVVALAAYFSLVPKREPVVERIEPMPLERFKEKMLKQNDTEPKPKNWQASVEQEAKSETKEPTRA